MMHGSKWDTFYRLNTEVKDLFLEHASKQTLWLSRCATKAFWMLTFLSIKFLQQMNGNTFCRLADERSHMFSIPTLGTFSGHVCLYDYVFFLHLFSLIWGFDNAAEFWSLLRYGRWPLWQSYVCFQNTVNQMLNWKIFPGYVCGCKYHSFSESVFELVNPTLDSQWNWKKLYRPKKNRSAIWFFGVLRFIQTHIFVSMSNVSSQSYCKC